MSKNKLEDIIASMPALPDNPTYDNQSYNDSEEGKAALGAYNAAKDAINEYGEFNFSQNELLENVKQGIQNYGPFSYDFNGDALYQQYKDKYIQQGKLAMADTMGQAAAMTGGYGNSYAQSVGQQAYQGQLDNLNDIIPELYQMALERYKMGKEDLYNQYGLLLKEYEREYGLYSDEYNKLLDALGISKDDYYSGGDMFYKNQNNKNTVLGQEFTDAMAVWNANTGNIWEQANYDLAVRDLAMKEEALELEKKALTQPTTKPSTNTAYQSANQSHKDKAEANKEKDGTTLTYDDIRADLGTFIKNGADKSEINNYLRGALKAGYIDNAMYNKLKDLYAPRGYTY